MTNESFSPSDPSMSLPAPEAMQAMTGAAALNSKKEEQLNEGFELLGNNLLHVAEVAGPEGVDDYLGDLLADMESKSPLERQAAFELLSHKQKEALDKQLMASGGTMVEALTANDEVHAKSLSESRGGLLKGLGRAREAHDRSIIGPSRSGRIDPRGLQQAHGAVADALGSGTIRGLNAHAENVTSWLNGKKHPAKEFKDKMEDATKHKQALAMAGKVVDPEYDGEPKDISRVVDNDVRASVASTLVTELSAAQNEGRSPAEVLAKMIEATKSNSPRSLIATLSEMATTFSAEDSSWVKVRVDGARHSISRYIAKGNDEYTQRGATPDIIQGQDRLMGEIAANIDELTRRAAGLYESSHERVRRAEAGLRIHAQKN